MKKLYSSFSMATIASLALATPTPALADAYDDCVEVCIQYWLTPPNVNPVMYEFCRSECERKYPPGVVRDFSMDARLD